ncbi:MAG: putative peptidoglycan glycosyltransferase FtsW [Candidatus Gracilibacteria bacterium]|nr:putative peptidoglycan glycosyltransferase FtsW [Candidatus Gracilibacteria bacterium]
MRKTAKFDTVLASAVIFLLIFGLIMITSIGVPKSISLSAPGVLYPNCGDPDVDCYLLFKKHLYRLIFGLGVFFIAWKFPLRFWKKLAPLIFGAAVLSLFFVMFAGQSFGTIATNWVVFFNTSFQPSEFAKLAAIIYFSYWFSKKSEDEITDLREGFLPFCVLALLIVGPIVFQNDFGGTFVITLISATIYFIAGARIRHLGLGLLIAFLLGIIFISSVSHVRERFTAFTRIHEECVEDYCWQSRQANIAVGSGGFFGKGLTQGVQKSYWLPQASDDFIFAASAEELGFLRIIFVVLAYFVIAIRGYSIANKSESNFEMFMAVGITTWIVSQAFINIAVNTALFPVTGITLPFVSYGGSSLVTSLIGVGILLNISQHTGHYANTSNWRRNRGARDSKSGHYRRS